jgi:single-strand DNA-binding protein
MYNKVIIMGRISNDLELKTTQQGASVLAFSVAVDRRYQVKGEEKKTDFFNVVAWRNEAEFISKYFSKGRKILIEGELQTRAYTDKNNNTVRVTEIIVDRACFTGEKKPDASASQTPPTVSAGQPDVAEMVVSASDEDYPF